MKQFITNHKEKIITISFFLILFIIGLFFIRNIDVYFDENPEKDILKSNIREYAQLIDFDRLDQHLGQEGIPVISESIEKDHGISAFYLYTPLLTLKRVSLHLSSVMWHLYTYTIVFIGVIYFYKLINYLFKNKKVSYVSTLLYFFAPRIFIDGLYNNKDMVLLSLLVVMIFYGFRFIFERDKKSLILFSIVSAFVCNTKIIGLYFLGIIGLGYIIKMIIYKEFNKKNFLYGLAAAILTVLIYIFLTPAIWGSGKIQLIEFIKYCLDNGMAFSRFSGAILFEGVRYSFPDNPLPWYYLPKMIVITLPIIYSILFVIGIPMMVYRYIKSRNKELLFKLILLLMIFIVPFMIAVLKHPVIYNGWRHFYFLYAPIMILASYSIYNLVTIKNVKYIVYGLCILTLCFNGYYIVRYGIRNTAYYNILVNRNTLDTNYELDYYNVTSQDATYKFINSGNAVASDDGYIYIYGPNFNHRVVSDLYEYTTQYLQSKIKEVKPQDLKDTIKSGKIVYALCNSAYLYDDMSNYELVYSYKIFDSSIIWFYKLK